MGNQDSIKEETVDTNKINRRAIVRKGTNTKAIERKLTRKSIHNHLWRTSKC